MLRCLSELSCPDTVYTSDKGKEYRFNTAECLNGLLLYVAVKSGLLSPVRKYDLDFDHEFLTSETWDAMPTYKHFDGYGPGCAVATDPQTGLDVIVGIENRDGNTPVKFFDERSDQGRLPPGGHAGAYPAEFHRARAEDPLCTYRLRLVHEERRQASS